MRGIAATRVFTEQKALFSDCVGSPSFLPTNTVVVDKAGVELEQEMGVIPRIKEV